MATSGKITGKAYNSSGYEASTYIFEINWQRNSYSVENNTSNITVSLQIQRKAGYTNGAYNLSKYPSVSLAVNGSSKTPTISYIDTRNNKLCTFATWTGNVTHNDDGSLTCPISASFTHYGSDSLGSGSASGSASLDTIPRASTMDSLSCSTAFFDGMLSYKYTPKSQNYYNQYHIYLNINDSFTSVKSSNLGQKLISQQSASVTLSSSELAIIYNKLPSATKGVLRFIIRTYSDSGYSNQIGRDNYKDIELTIPESKKPSIGSVSLTLDSLSTLIQAKNRITVSTSNCKPGDGSSIKSYVFDVLSGNTVIATTTTTSTSATFGPFTQTGSLKFRVTVTDQRSRSVNNSGSEPTKECYAYTTPFFSSFTAHRCDSSGTANDNGTNIKYSLNINYADVGDTNTAVVKIYYKKSTDSNWTTAQNALSSNTATSASAIIKNTSGSNITFNASDTYLVRAEITDTYSSSGIYSSTITVFGASRIFNIRQNGSGMAFGKMAESDNLLECKWPAKFNDNCDVLGTLKLGMSSQYETPKHGIHVHDVRYVDITPDSFGDNNVNFYFDQIESMNNRWMGIMHVKGWSGTTNAAWELAGNCHSNRNDDTLRYRQGMEYVTGSEQKWGDWQTVLTNKNIAANSVATLYENTSGTTGTITLSQSAANFAYLEFFLTKDTASGWWSVKVPSPNGKNVQIGTQYFANSGTTESGVGLQFIGKTLTISGTTVTQNQEYYMNFDKSLDGNVVGAGTQTTVKVMKVLGHKY